MPWNSVFVQKCLHNISEALWHAFEEWQERTARAMGLCQTLISTFLQRWLKRSGESTSGTSNPSTWPHTGKLWNVNYLKLNFRIWKPVKPVLKLLTEDMLKPSNEDTTLTLDIKQKMFRVQQGKYEPAALQKLLAKACCCWVFFLDIRGIIPMRKIQNPHSSKRCWEWRPESGWRWRAISGATCSKENDSWRPAEVTDNLCVCIHT